MTVSAEQLSSFIDTNKPLLLFSSKEEQYQWFKSIKSKQSFQSLLDEIKVEAEMLGKEPLRELSFFDFTRFRDTGSRLEYEKHYFNKRKRLNTFAIMCLLEPDKSEYLKELHEVIWSICNEYSWCLPAHLKDRPEMLEEIDFLKLTEQQGYTIDLFSAETAFALSEIYRLTEDVLDPLIKKRILQEVHNRIFTPFQLQAYFWETSTHNWAAVCAGSIGAAALHLLNDQQLLADILERVMNSLQYYLKGFNDDGGCLEGYGYWQYGFGFYVYFADLLKVKTAGNVDLFNNEKVHRIALFQQKCFINKKKVVNFSDSTEEATVFLGLSHYLNNLYPDIELPKSELRASYVEDHCSRWAPAIRNLLWFDESKRGQEWKDATYYLNDSHWLISRDKGFVFACKGGHNDEPHNHNDIGHFILQAKGETFLKDLGSGMYCEAYFSEKRYEFLCNGSQGHSVPIINNQLQKDGPKYCARILDQLQQDEEDMLEMDLAKAYEVPELNSLVRRFVWKKVNKPELVLTDTYTFSSTPDSVVERFITPVLSLSYESDGIVLSGDQRLKISYDSSQLDLTVHEKDFLNHFGEKEAFYQLDFSVKSLSQLCRVEFEFFFL
ncbi:MULTISPECIES: heparinase II/III family protein [Bacillaceae]|uniref:heparinase II/III family protein n=1 Tax=Bacillaceae TaxID=186817 RepID=UPI000BFB1A83|nr:MULTISPECIES: heparinase II/III family protein [Bacillaceae]PGT84905.1 hypothetical protein COD11_09905 [Bacillus sp. AFS040349]UGB32028.1 heparinase II/III-family protein [Metabacillus sp. B2-18]